MSQNNSINIKERFQFFAGLRFELFYALQAVTDKENRIHQEWVDRAHKLLPKEFWKKFEELGGSTILWPLIPDTIKDIPSANPDFDQIVVAIQALSHEKFQRRLLEGAIHSADLTQEILKSPKDIQKIIGKVPAKKREWLTFIGLYPYDENHPNTKMLTSLLKPTPAFQKKLVEILEIFWKFIFADTWQQLLPQFEKSLAAKERLFNSCSFGEFATQSLLRIEIDESKKVIKAVRGGYELPFTDLSVACIIPSAFNDKRYWTAYETKQGTFAYFPYFDPAIEAPKIKISGKTSYKEPSLDIAYIFKALGDPTRFAIITRIAQQPSTATELAKQLGVSKPTISHHVHTLRDAGSFI